jgi:GAF domain-containing protein
MPGPSSLFCTWRLLGARLFDGRPSCFRPQRLEAATSYPENLTNGLRAMSLFLVGDANLADTLTRVAELATDSLPNADFAGMTLMTDNGPRTSIFTDPESPEIDQTQYDTGNGPCLDSMRDGVRYRIDSTEEDTRWRAFSRTCLDHGIHSTLSLPLVVGEDKAVGALNLYSHQRAGFDQDAEENGTAFAEQAAVVLSNAQAYWGAFEMTEQLQTALVSRPVIEQAKGIIMAQSHVSAEEAFQILVRASQRENVKLREVAAQIVERAQKPPPA